MPVRLLVIFCAVWLSGCASLGGYPQNPINTEAGIDPFRYYFGAQVLVDFNAYPSEEFRNEIIYGRIAAYDAEFARFQSDIGGERKAADAAGDIAIAVMGAVGASTVSKSTKTALLAATAATTGVKNAIDKDLFYDQALGSIFSYMAAARTTARATILANTAKTLKEYPLTEGISDTLVYRDAGSLPTAMSAIAEKTGKAKADAEQSMQIAKAENARITYLRSRQAPKR